MTQQDVDMDIWGEEGGLMLRLTRQPNGNVLFEVIEPFAPTSPVSGTGARIIGAVTIARFRQPRIAGFLAKPTEDAAP